MGKYLLKKLVIIETLMIGIVSLFIVMNYFSNNTIWDLIIHDEPEDVLLYENKDATSKAKVQIYEKWSLSLFDRYIRVDITFNNLETYSYSTVCYASENLDFNNTQDVNVKWKRHIPSIYMRNHPTITIKSIIQKEYTGSAKWNQKLSEARAQAVYDALIKEGVSKDQLELVGFGGTANMFGKNFLNRVVILE